MMEADVIAFVAVAVAVVVVVVAAAATEEVWSRHSQTPLHPVSACTLTNTASIPLHSLTHSFAVICLGHSVIADSVVEIVEIVDVVDDEVVGVVEEVVVVITCGADVVVTSIPSHFFGQVPPAPSWRKWHQPQPTQNPALLQ